MIQLISSVVTGSDNKPIAIDLRIDGQHSQRPVVIFLHGFKGFKDWGHFPKVGEELAKVGFAFVSFNFTHDGTTLDRPMDFTDLEAFGNNNYNKELFDTKQVIDGISDGTLFPEADLNREQIFLLGHSRGGAMSIVKTREDERIKGLVTWASVGDLKRTQADMEKWKRDGVVYIPNARTDQQMPMYHQFVEDYSAQEERYSLEKSCNEITVPSLFIHGKDDTTVPYSDALQLEEWCSSGKAFLVENGDHTFGGKHPFLESELPELSRSALKATIKHLGSII